MLQVALFRSWFWVFVLACLMIGYRFGVVRTCMFVGCLGLFCCLWLVVGYVCGLDWFV